MGITTFRQPDLRNDSFTFVFEIEDLGVNIDVNKYLFSGINKYRNIVATRIRHGQVRIRTDNF